MKLLQIHRRPSSPAIDPPDLTVHPGSALIGSASKPFFVPDTLAPRWQARPAVAFRLSRLGRNIDVAFAARYYDAVAPALLFEPADGPIASMPQLQASIDATVAIGQWQEPVPDGAVTLSGAAGTIGLTAADIDVDRVIQCLSRYVTIQMGDILIPCRLPVAVPVEPETSVSVALGSAPPLTVRVK